MIGTSLAAATFSFSSVGLFSIITGANSTLKVSFFYGAMLG